MFPIVWEKLSLSARSSPHERIPGPLDVSTPSVLTTSSHVLQSASSQDDNARHIMNVIAIALSMLFFIGRGFVPNIRIYSISDNTGIVNNLQKVYLGLYYF